jgi:hypothetical protein
VRADAAAHHRATERANDGGERLRTDLVADHAAHHAADERAARARLGFAAPGRLVDPLDRADAPLVRAFAGVVVAHALLAGGERERREGRRTPRLHSGRALT